jgi:hypothetical protein
MFRIFVIFALFFVIGSIGESAAQDKAKERAGVVTGEFKTRKDAKNGRSVTLEILAPGEEKARAYLLSYNPKDPKAKGRYLELVALVDAAKIGDRVECGWVNSPPGAEGAFFLTSFRVLKKPGAGK